MTDKEFNKRVDNDIVQVCEQVENVENLSDELQKFKGVFHYAAWCEHNFERNLREDYERKTTFTSDFSIAEWCGGRAAVIDTLQRALKGWKSSIEYFGELLIAVNMKSWEHAARGNAEWAALYSELYYFVKDLYFDWFEGNDDAIDYYYDYID